ncbi:MAG: hypothetical protein LBP55_01755, partial [Candidatus Adiutrix sp.]|nr:hypothetical protein [Candidatus Adiutrix sp.]
MSQSLSPYDREDGFLEANIELAVTLALIFSLGLHLLLAWVFFFLFPSLMTGRRDLANEIITVQLMGSLAPPAPAAPANLPVNPDLKGPDVVEAPKTDPTPAITQPAFPPAPEAVTAPADVIPLGPKAPEKPPEIKKKATPPPKPTPPKVETEPPKPRPKKPSADAEIKKALADMERKVAAQNNDDDDVDARYVNRNLAQGRGDGQS